MRGCSLAAGGRWLISEGEDALRVWDLEEGRELASCPSPYLSCVADVGDGRRLVLGRGSGDLELWDLATGRMLASWLGHAAAVVQCLVMDGGKTLVSLDSEGELRGWDLAAPQPLWNLADVSSVAPLPDGRTLVSGSSTGRICRYDTATGRELGAWDGPRERIAGCAATPDGSRAATFSLGMLSSTLALWAVETGQELARWELGRRAFLDSATRAFASAFGRREKEDVGMVAAGWHLILRDGRLRIFDLRTAREVASVAASQRSLTALQVMPGGGAAVSGADDGTAGLWPLAADGGGLGAPVDAASLETPMGRMAAWMGLAPAC